MIGLDTNVILRYLLQDDAAQSSRATRLLGEELTPKNRGFISVVTIVETVWTLERRLRLDDATIVAALESLLQSESIAFEREQDVFLAMVALQDGTGDFADALIGALGARAGCTHTLTFDRKAARLPGFQLA